MVLGKVYRVSYALNKEGVCSILLEHRNDKSEALLFETEAIGILSATETDSVRHLYSTITDAYGCLGVLQIALAESSQLMYLVLVTGCVSVGKIQQSEVFRITDVLFLSMRNNPHDLERVQELKKVLSSGTYYFSWSNDERQPFDITLCAQRRSRTNETDNRFFWNRILHVNFTRYGIDTKRWLIKAMCGGISISTVYVGSQQAKACLISRLSCERAGTRFNVRGVNDDGNVANFVETEQVIYMEDDRVSSYVIIRGSVPLFWEQPGVNVGSHKIKMSRGSEVSQPAYERHFIMLKKRYGKQFIVTLMGSKEGETMLTKLYKAHHRVSNHANDIPLVAFNYHEQCPRGRQENLTKKLKPDLQKALDAFGFYTFQRGAIKSYQCGTFRVNCVDCLDRTNSVQTFLGLEMLGRQLQSIGLTEKPQISARFFETYTNMWIQNGDQCARIYAGTGAMEGKSKIKDSTLSVARTIQNNLLDNNKQEAIDILLMGKALNNEYADRARSLLSLNYMHLPPNILVALCDRHLEFTEPKKLRLMVGTWNVNGGKHFNSIVYKRSDPLSDWLLDNQKTGQKSPNIMDLSLDDSLNEVDQGPADIYAIGFEEIVDLNASNIMAASTTNQKEWLVELQKTISRDVPYVPITSVQLVGVCLFIFVRPEHARHIRDVSIDQVKTGLGGATGNKGGVAIRFRYHASSLAFVCAHFAAGQKLVMDRNADYAEITRKVSFPLGRSLNSHDYVFWCGDFNYRIDMPGDEVKKLVSENNIDALLEKDQLTVQMRDGRVFKNYVEAKITFPPTYKYDINSDDFDSSEKCRIPAYTDRVLFKKTHPTRPGEEHGKLNYGRIVHYGRAELKTSDHRPVIAIIDVDMLVVDSEKRHDTFLSVLEELGPPDATVLVNFVDREKGEVFSEPMVNTLMRTLANEAGEVIIGRFGEDGFRVTFRDGRSTLKAIELDGMLIDNKALSVKLKTPNWVEILEKELEMTANNTVPLSVDAMISLDDEEEELNISTGPACDPSALCIEHEADDNISGEHSGRSSPSTVSADGDSEKPPPIPGRPGSAPTRPPPPTRPPAPKQITVTDSPVKPKPLRAAPLPPMKPQLLHQTALNPPSITRTEPSTDSEGAGSFERKSSTDKDPKATPHVAQEAPPDVLSEINNAWTSNDVFAPSFPPPIPPPRLDSVESDLSDDQPPLSPWQSLPPAPPIPPLNQDPFAPVNVPNFNCFPPSAPPPSCPPPVAPPAAIPSLPPAVAPPPPPSQGTPTKARPPPIPARSKAAGMPSGPPPSLPPRR
ncbi:Synaptojanin-1 [Halotydeus destructor]|nr:Synaptojanin-1 [Halotydeus destructor]